MNKNEIYERVVRFTKELEERGISREFLDTLQYAKLFNDYSVIDSNLKMISYKYPELYTQIVQFGKAYNRMIGDTETNWDKYQELLDKGGSLIYNLASTGIIREIVKDNFDSERFDKLIKEFKEEHIGLVYMLKSFQKNHDILEARFKNVHKGEIFGADQDVENGVYIFDTNVIDSLSFFLFSILAHIDIQNFFYYEDYGAGSNYGLRSFYAYTDDIKAITNDSFAELAGEYYPFDWIGDGKGEYSTIGELLYEACSEKFIKHIRNLWTASK